MTDKLSKTQTKTLAAAETILQKHLASFFLCGDALRTIRDDRLFRKTHETFEAYCADTWDFSRQRAHQLITSAQAAADVSTIVDIAPERETHVRPLLAVPKDHRGEVWAAACKAAPLGDDGKPRMTARIVQEAVDRWHDRRKAEAPEPLVGHEAEVIDVDSRPVDRDEPEEPDTSDDEPAEEEYGDDAGEEMECPNCHRLVVADPEHGHCPLCLEPDLVEVEPEPEQDEPDESPDDELLRCTEEAFREQFDGRLAVGAARLETLADKLRSNL